jgi:hypothetical protein
MRRTVLFGPFIGEFGWELIAWQGWVRVACAERYAGWRTIACSYPGRAPLYPTVDEFWPLPNSFLALRAQPNQYVTAGWRGGYPGYAQPSTTMWKEFTPEGVTIVYEHSSVHKPLTTPDIEPQACLMLAELVSRLPPDTVVHAPWRHNKLDDGLEFGLLPESPSAPPDRRLQLEMIKIEDQLMEPLRASATGKLALDEIVPAARKMVSVFPRYRPFDPDRNWPAENYRALIARLQDDFPNAVFAIIGAPGETAFDDGVPDGCVDLIHVDDDLRLDLQLAALDRSNFSFGGASGATILALYARCPLAKWTSEEAITRDEGDNIFHTPQTLHPNVQPNVDEARSFILQFANRLDWSSCR